MPLRWIAAHRAALALIALASIVGVAAGFLLAPDGTKSTAVTQTITHTQTTTVVASRTITRRAAVVPSATVTSAPRGAHATAHPPATPASRGTAAGSHHLNQVATRRHFAGNGPRYLGDVTLASPATARWSSTGARFRLLFDGGSQAVDSMSRSGRLFVPAGTYYQVRVEADGQWTLKIG